MRHIDDFKFAIQNNYCIEIAGKFELEIFQGISFNISSRESHIWNPESDTLKSQANKFSSLDLTVTEEISIFKKIKGKDWRLGLTYEFIEKDTPPQKYLAELGFSVMSNRGGFNHYFIF